MRETSATMVTKDYLSLDCLLSWNSLIWASFVALLALCCVLRYVKIDRLLYHMKFFYIMIKLYLKYLPGGEKGLFESGFSEISRLSPTPYKIDNLFIPSFYVDKPADVQIVLNNANTLEKADIYKVTTKAVGRSLFGSEVSIWKAHRRLIAHSFQTKVLEEFSYIFNRKNQEGLERLREVADTGESLDLWDHLSLLSFDMLCETQMGVNSDEIFTNQEKKNFMDDIENFSKLIAYRVLRYWLHPDIIFRPLAKLRGWDSIERNLIKETKKIIEHRRLSIIEHEAVRMDVRKESICSIASEKEEMGGIFLRNLLDAKENGVSEFTENDLVQECVFMMIAGVETSGLTMCYTLLMLAMHPHLQDEIYKEIIDVMVGSGDERLIMIEDVERMELLDRCIKETLRLFPVIPILARDTSADVKLSDDQIAEKGTMMVIAPYLLHRNPDLYENPLVWDPANFLPEKVDKRHAYSFIPFSAGPRGCLGNRYAMLSMKVTLSITLKKYRVTTDMKMEDIQFKFDSILRCMNGYKVKFHTRHP